MEQIDTFRDAGKTKGSLESFAPIFSDRKLKAVEFISPFAKIQFCLQTADVPSTNVNCRHQYPHIKFTVIETQISFPNDIYCFRDRDCFGVLQRLTFQQKVDESSTPTNTGKINDASWKLFCSVNFCSSATEQIQALIYKGSIFYCPMSLVLVICVSNAFLFVKSLSFSLAIACHIDKVR